MARMIRGSYTRTVSPMHVRQRLSQQAIQARHVMIRCVATLAALMLSAHVACLGAQKSSLEDSVRALESQRAQALLNADTAALSQLVADDFVEISRLGTLRTKADNMREIASGILKLTSVRYDS